MAASSLKHMALTIRELDRASDDELTRAHEIVKAAMSHERPHASSPSATERLIEWRNDDPGERHDLLGAFDGDRLVGVSNVYFALTDNLSMAWGYPFVAPADRRQGVGSALMDHALASSREMGRSEFLTDIDIPPGDVENHPHYLFLRKNGFSYSYTEIIRRVMLPIDDALLTRYADAASEQHGSAYTLETSVGGVAQHRRESLCAAMNRLAVDAPTGDIDFEEETIDPARYQHWLDVEAMQDKVRITTLAIHEPSQVVAAYTDLMLPNGSPTHVHQWGTLVRSDHRGHRLGMAVKVANIRHLQEHYPERQHITTGNADTNRWMVQINEDLGFQILELNLAFKRPIPTS